MGKKVIGYTAGVYDMFHIGHLNLLKNAKKHCDYLIVGVNSDEATFSYKNKFPVIPWEERAEIVEAIKYVDEIVKVDNTGKIFAFEKYKPDFILVGNDHQGEQKWEEVDEYLRKHNSKVIFLEHTDHISSTILRPRETEKIKD